MIDLDLVHAACPHPRELAERLGLEVDRRASTRDQTRVTCVWHADTRPSLDLALRDGRVVAYCRACNQGGDVFALVAEINGLSVARDFVEVVKLTADIVGVVLPEADERRGQPARQPDVAVSLVRRVDDLVDAWLAGRRVHKCPVLRAASEDEIVEALQLFDLALEAGVERRRADERDVDLALDAVGAELERDGRLDWTDRDLERAR